MGGIKCGFWQELVALPIIWNYNSWLLYRRIGNDHSPKFIGFPKRNCHGTEQENNTNSEETGKAKKMTAKRTHPNSCHTKR